MTIARERVRSSNYMHWAKTRSHARFNLATSGLVNYPLEKLGAALDDLEISGPSWYGYEPLQKALAEKNGVPAECIVAATGTSMANHLVMAALLDPGDEVLIEEPTYEPIISLARYLGAEVKRFRRRFEDSFRVDVDEVREKISSRTRLVVLTNLHNPSSAYTDEETLRKVGEVARSVGTRVLVDEVYLDSMFEKTPPTAFQLGEEFIVTSSLTKVYGLSGLRCGWILAAPELAQKCWRLNDLFGVIPAHAAERLSVVALENLGRITGDVRAHLETNRQILNSFLRTRDELETIEPEFGTVVFPRVKDVNVDALCPLLAEKYETSVVPGRFFEMLEHIRIGIGGETAALSSGLECLGAALDELRLR